MIAESVAHATVDFYDALKAAVPALSSLTVTWDGSHDFSHTFPTESAGIDCDKVGTPFLGKCGFDGAGAVFHALYGAPLHKVARPKANCSASTRMRCWPDGKDAALADEGVAYVPPACLRRAAAAACWSRCMAACKTSTASARLS